MYNDTRQAILNVQQERWYLQYYNEGIFKNETQKEKQTIRQERGYLELDIKGEKLQQDKK